MSAELVGILCGSLHVIPFTLYTIWFIINTRNCHEDACPVFLSPPLQLHNLSLPSAFSPDDVIPHLSTSCPCRLSRLRQSPDPSPPCSCNYLIIPGVWIQYLFSYSATCQTSYISPNLFLFLHQTCPLLLDFFAFSDGTSRCLTWAFFFFEPLSLWNSL